MKILLVHNSPRGCAEIAGALGASGYRDVLAVTSLSEALSRMTGEGPEDRPSLVILSLDLGDIDGVDACRLITSTPALSGAPVVVVAGPRVDDARLEAAFEAGAFDYVPEPVGRRELAARVRAALRHRKLTDELRVQKALSLRSVSTNEFLRNQGSTDPLTGLANRGKFEDTLYYGVRDAIRRDAWYSLLLVDIDHFGNYNNRYGHRPGDDCLRRVSGALTSSLVRTTDTAARYGGEELAALLPDTDEAGALIVAERIRAGVEALGIRHEASETARVVTVSVGAASLRPSRAATPDLLVLAADKALYRAKRGGRNRREAATAADFEEAARDAAGEPGRK